MQIARRRRSNSALRLAQTYFFQIAKLRAFRMLWARAVESFGGSQPGRAEPTSRRALRDGTRPSTIRT